MAKKIPEYDNFKNRLAPTTFYQELAQHGDLYSFVQEYLSDLFDKDENFRQRIYTLIVNNSPEVVPEIEEYLLHELHQALSVFLEQAALCRK